MANYCLLSPRMSSSASPQQLAPATALQQRRTTVYSRRRSIPILLLMVVLFFCHVSPSWAALRGGLAVAQQQQEGNAQLVRTRRLHDVEVQDHPVIYPSHRNDTSHHLSNTTATIHDLFSASASHRHHRILASGRRTILVIRVLASDRSPSATASSLQQYIFTDTDSLANQMSRCSAGVLQLAPAPYGNGGIVDVPISAQSSDVPSMIAESQQVAAQYIPGVTNLYAAANHVMFVFPQTSNYVAEAEIGGRYSWFNDQLAEAISVIMHEIGHNLGLDHAGIPSDEYGDYSANMGRSVSTKSSPLMCYNAANNWQLGWYPNGRYTMSSLSSTPTRITIGSFVNYPTTNPVLVKLLSDTFLQYNDPSRHNVGSRANTNQVVIVRQESTKHTTFLAGLSPGQVYQGNGFVVEVCSINTGSTADISIGQSSTNCGVGGGNVIPAPGPTIPVISWGGSTPRVTPTQPWLVTTPTSSTTSFFFTPTPPTPFRFTPTPPVTSFGSSWTAKAWASLVCTIFDSSCY